MLSLQIRYTQTMANTDQEFKQVMQMCRALFEKKLHDYGPAWRILRIPSLTDQLYIKAKRIRSINEEGAAEIHEGSAAEFMGIVNYGLIGLIQLELKPDVDFNTTEEEALKLYDKYAEATYQLMVKKNHDYDEAWRGMRISSYTDLILRKIYRTKQIEELGGNTLVSEGIDANYQDMINYAVFALIKLVIEKS